MSLNPAEVAMLVQRIKSEVGDREFGRLTIAEVVRRFSEAKWRYLGERMAS